MHLSESGGTPWLQAKSKVTFNLASNSTALKVLTSAFGFKFFIIVATVAHRVANLCISVANAPFREWGDTLVATKK